MDSDARLQPPESPARGPSSELGRGPGYPLSVPALGPHYTTEGPDEEWYR